MTDTSSQDSGTGPPTAAEKAYPKALREAEAQRLSDRWTKVGDTRQSLKDPLDGAVGVALSGGGIRSATFCLGVFQALARHRLVRKIDYLSTVSGGGYFGAFLGAWLNRATDPVEGVESKLGDSQSAQMQWLRDNGRYISPNGAADFWFNVATALRNWLALHVTLATFVLAALLAADLVRWCASWSLFHVGLAAPTIPRGSNVWWSPWLFLPASLLALWLVPAAWAYWLTQTDAVRSGFWCPRWLAGLLVLGATVLVEFSWWQPPPHYIEPLFLAVWALVVAGISFRQSSDSQQPGESAAPTWLTIVVAALAVTAAILAWWPHVPAILQSAVFFSSVLIVGSVTAVIVKEAFRQRDLQWPPWITVLGVLILSTAGASWDWDRSWLLVFALLSALTLSFYGRAIALERRVDVQEQVGATRLRLSRWLTGGLLIVLASTAFALVDTAGQSFYAASQQGDMLRFWQWVGTALGVSSLGALLPKLALLVSQLTKKDRPSVPVSIVAGTASLLAITVILVLLSVAAHAISWAGKGPVSSAHMAGPYIVGGLLVTGLLSVFFGQTLLFINLSSLQNMYQARLTRAYLGASNPHRLGGSDPLARQVSVLAPGDQVRMEEYSPDSVGGPLHLINVTVNETIDGKSHLEQFDRKGMNMAVGPCGLSVGVKHHALWGAPGGTPDLRDCSRLKPVRFENQFHVLDKSGVPRRYRLLPPGLREWLLQRRTHQVESLSVGNWIAVSGAAFTTGLGARTSLGMSLLLGLVNIRLGYWWNSDAKADEQKDRVAPNWAGELFSWFFPVQSYLLDELLARFHGTTRQYWYLSDGGHFENTAAYELIRRRLPFIVICDNGQDEAYGFEDFANLVRKARTDFAAEIVPFTEEHIRTIVHPKLREVIGTLDELRPPKPPTPNAPGTENLRLPYSSKHATLAWVFYADQNLKSPASSPSSVILLIKPNLTGDEPPDVRQYKLSKPTFPQESTLDQYFDEAQWESYRKLGEHIGWNLFSAPEDPEAVSGRSKLSGPGQWSPSEMGMPRYGVVGGGDSGRQLKDIIVR